jgi:hypothetical protein
MRELEVALFDAGSGVRFAFEQKYKNDTAIPMKIASSLCVMYSNGYSRHSILVSCHARTTTKLALSLRRYLSRQRSDCALAKRAAWWKSRLACIAVHEQRGAPSMSTRFLSSSVIRSRRYDNGIAPATLGGSPSSSCAAVRGNALASRTSVGAPASLGWEEAHVRRVGVHGMRNFGGPFG